MRSILVVDDHPANRELLVTLLGYAGYGMLEAADGAEALEVVRAKQPDLVVCDILMPTMDGYEFVRQLRAAPTIAHTKVIFHTAHYHEREARNLARACGVLHVLTKPSEPEVVLRIVAEVLGGSARSESMPRSMEFDREHLRLVTDKLSGKVDELQSINQRLATLIELNLQLASERDPQDLLAQVCRGARDLIGCRYSTLGIRGKDDDPKTRYFTTGIPPHAASGFASSPLDDGIFAAVLTERRAFRLQEEEGRPVGPGLPPGHPRVSSLLVAPVASLSSVYGWICLTDKLGAEGFSDEDERLLTILGAQVGRIYENGSLYARIQRHAGRLQEEIAERGRQQHKIARLNRIQAVLSGINSAIVRIRNRDELFNEACRIAVEHGRLEMAWIGMIDRSAMKVEPIASAGSGTDLLTVIRLSIREDGPEELGVIGIAVTSRAPVVVNDIGSDARVLYKTEQMERGFRSWVALPLLVDTESVGVLALYATEPAFFDDEEMRLLSDLAGDVSFAMEYLEKEEKLNYLAYYDVLTGLANRSLLQDRLEQALHFAQRYRLEVAVLAVDLDRFKLVNDTLGHTAGDEMLRLAAARLVGCVRGVDTVARLGGDEFLLVLAGIEDGGAGAMHIAQRILAAFAQPVTLENREVFVTCSIGAALYPRDGREGEILLKNADAAMYRAKEQGRNNCQFYTRQAADRAEQRLSLEAGLRRALERDELRLHYQPQIDLHTGEVSGLEALIRWQRPGSPMVPPDQFIPMAEEIGLILPIGEWVLRTACAQIKAWQAQGLPSVPIAVNLSAHQFRRPDLSRQIEEILVQTGLDPKYLELELTESMLMHDVELALGVMSDLRKIGVRIALDDFGTGYSSLSYLRKFRIDALKVDKSFVQEITSNVDSATIAEAIIVMAKSLRLCVIAEGVETEAQLAFLLAKGCDRMQGYLFSRPVPPDQLSQLLAEGRRLPLPSPATQVIGGTRTLLLVDDDARVLAALVAALQQEGYDILTADSPSAAFEALARTPVQVIVSDQSMPGMNGAQFLGQVKDIYPRTVRVMLSGYTDLSSVTHAISEGAIHRFLTKPWEDEQLRAELRDAFQRAGGLKTAPASGDLKQPPA